MSSPITTHVLDTARGGPAPGVPITLEQREGDGWIPIASGTTDDDGRIVDLINPGTLEASVYRMVFDTGTYFEANDTEGFYPEVPVIFEIRAPNEHYHVPLLISPFGYSTYRGS